MSHPARSHALSRRADSLIGIVQPWAESLSAVRRDVERMMEECRVRDDDETNRDLSYAVSSKLIRRSAIRVGRVGALTAVPMALPGLGALSAALVATTVDLAYLIRVQSELCYGISVAYGVDVGEEVPALTLALLTLLGGKDAVRRAAPGPLRNLVTAATARYVKKGLTDVLIEVAERLGPRYLGRMYKFVPFVGIPVSASVNIASTFMVGNRAVRYFSACRLCEDEIL